MSISQQDRINKTQVTAWMAGLKGRVDLTGLMAELKGRIKGLAGKTALPDRIAGFKGRLDRTSFSAVKAAGGKLLRGGTRLLSRVKVPARTRSMPEKASRKTGKNRWLCLDIADQNVRFVWVEKSGRGGRVTSAGRCQTLVKWDRPGSLLEVLEEICPDETARPQRIFVSVSHSDFVVNQLVLPAMSTRELKEVIFSEIEKIPKYSLQKFDYIFQERPESLKKRSVVFACVPQDALNFIFNEVKTAKLPFNHLEVSPLNFKEITQLIAPSSDREAILVVHDQHTYLMVSQGKQYHFIYKSFQGIDQILAQGSQGINEYMLNNWLAEIQRVIKSYIMKRRNVHLSKIWIVWDKERIADLDKRLENKLEARVYPVCFDQVKRYSAEGAIGSNPIYTLPLVPLICRNERLKLPFPLGFFFRSFQVKRYSLQTALTCLVAVTLMILLSLDLNTGLLARTEVLREKITAVDQKIARTRTESEALLSQYRDYRAVRQRLLAQAAFVHDLNRVSWSRVFSEVAEGLPQDLSLTSFSFTGSEQAQIKGRSLEMDTIADLMRRIERSDILSESKFSFLKESRQQETKIYDFGVFARLKQEEAVHDQE